LFQRNSTIYLAGSRIKYLFFNGTSFELSSIAYDPSVYELLDHARQTKSLEQFAGFLEDRHSLSRRNAVKLVKNLAELQLLLPDSWPNILGTEYFKRQHYHDPDPGPKYMISERKLLSGHLGQAVIRELPETFAWLNRALPPQANGDLDRFKTRFIEKFGQQEVPLGLALDPETGIGYGNLEANPNDEDVIAGIKASFHAPDTEKTISWTPLNRFLVNSIATGGMVRLESFRPPAASPTPFPNTFSAIVRIADNMVVVERAGGCTANALLGRFSLALPGFEEMGRAIARLEKQANPDILFFDIGYMAEGRVDNVNRRKLLYEAELALMTYSLADTRLQLDDILVSVIAGEIVIRSQRFNRRLVPRVASAYNYVRSDLSLFRFLSDLQHQGISSSLTFDFKKLVPGLNHYPRVQFKNVVVSPAKWRVPEEFTRAGTGTVHQTLAALKSWLDANTITKFSCGSGDQKLVIRKDNDDDLHLFLRHVSGDAGSYIEEYVEPKRDLVTDRDGDGFAAEFILTCFHRNALYRPLPKPLGLPSPQRKSYFLPGQTWLYFEIFCHHALAETVLNDYLCTYLSENRQQLALWFFIRYNDPSSHVRFRLKLKNAADGYRLTAALSACLEPLFLEGLISDIRVKTYRQEIERYGADIMPLVETCFWQDSRIALQVVHRQCTYDQRYLLSISLMEKVFEELSYDYQRCLGLLERMANAFKVEFKLSAPAFRKVNEGFKRFTATTDDQSFDTGVSKAAFGLLLKAMIRTLHPTTGDRQEKLLADLFHMHINRLFDTDQRIHEMIIYHYLIYRFKRKHFKQAKDRVTASANV
jgi:thiopeptide-type bacteriocin biosynthesis protein